MGAHVQCPRCEQAYALSDEQALMYAGREFECAQCTLMFMIPATSARKQTSDVPATLRGELPREQLTAAAVRAPAGMALPYPTFGPRPLTFLMDEDETRVASSRLAAASLVFGIIGLIVPVIPGALAIILGVIATFRIYNGKAQGASLAAGGVAIGAAGLFLSGALVYPRIMPAIERVRQASASQPQCVDNFHTIERALMAHAAENNGRFPDSLADLIAAGRLGAAALICAASGDTHAPGDNAAAIAERVKKGRHCSYVYVGKGLTKQSPSESVLLYEPLSSHRQSGISVLFVDGRVQTIGKIEAGKAVTRLSAGQNPPWTTQE